MGNGGAGRERRPARSGWGLGSSIGLRSGRPDRRAVLYSFAFHAALVMSLVVTGVLQARNVPEFEAYRVKLYSPPPQVEAPKPEVPQPQVTQTIVTRPKPETVQPPRRVDETKRPEATPTEEKPPEKKPEPTRGENAKPDSPGGEGIEVETSGAEFPYPAYLENIIVQIRRFFRWSGNGEPENVIAFYINRDGTVGGLQIVERSGDYMFDIQTIEAVELAGRRGMFGALPDGWVQDRLWVKFRFLPPGR